MQLALSHLGYRQDSPKIVTICPGVDHHHLPERIPFYLRQNCFRMPRERVESEGFSKCFPCPFDLLEGKLIPEPVSSNSKCVRSSTQQVVRNNKL